MPFDGRESPPSKGDFMPARSQFIAILISLLPLISYGAAPQPDYFRILEVEKAWDITRGDPSVVVGVLSTGLNYKLDEISGAMYSEGYNSISHLPDAFDASAKLGTSDAAVIAGATLGIAPNVKVLPVQVVSNDGYGTYENLIDGIYFAARSKVRIIYLGAGGSDPDRKLCETIESVGRANDILFVGVAGNNGEEIGPKQMPGGCNSPYLITVTACDEDGFLSSFANYSSRLVHLAAPTDNAASLGPDGHLIGRQGTTMAAAMTAAVAALVRSAHPELSSEQVKMAILRGSKYRASLENKVSSSGVLNAFGALQVFAK
jgi:subtilisin family serine protease